MKDETGWEFLNNGLAAKHDTGGKASGGNKRPNIMLIITDQQRQAQHWPKHWVRDNLPTMKRLQDNGVTFTNNFTAASACAPSRATFLTGVYPSVHGVTDTPPRPPLPPEIFNIFKMVEANKEYEAVYKGKMHLFTPASNPSLEDFTDYDIGWASQYYSMHRWNPPDDATDATASIRIAGGWPDNDTRYVNGVPHNYTNRMAPAVGGGETILEYLDNYDPDNDKPFFMVCSFGNPHDITIWHVLNEWGYNKAEYENLKDIKLPSNYNDDLKEKPIAQTKFQELCDQATPCFGTENRIDYCRFYAYLHTVVDKHIAAVLDKLDEKGLTEDTIIFRFADHGEQGFSHGMEQKGLNSYQETINVPLIISNPKLPSRGEITSSFASLIDLVPTIAEITGTATQEELKEMGICGKSLVPIIRDPSATVRDNVIFYTEDFQYFFHQYMHTIKNYYEIMPGNIRSIRTEDWMYAVYFTDTGSEIQYEMYNMIDDPGQLKNLAWGSRQKANLKQMQNLHDMLTAELILYQAMPKDFQWPARAGTESV